MTTAPRIPRHRPLWADTIPDAGSRPACTSDACCQGRRPCPTPQACQCSADDDADGLPGGAMVLMIAVGLVAVVAGISLLAGYLSVVLP